MALITASEPVNLGSYYKGSFVVYKALSSVLIAASGNSSSLAMDVTNLRGFFGCQWVITGDGTGKIEVLSSVNGADFLDVNSDVATAQTKITGPATDGKNAASFTLIPCSLFKFKVTETGGANSITISLWVKGY